MPADHNNPAPPLWLVLAVGAEILALAFLVTPAGSLLTPTGTPYSLAHIGVVAAAAVLLGICFRLAPGGPPVRAIFYAPDAVPLGRSLYYGVVAAIILTLLRAAVVVVAQRLGAPYAVTLGGLSFAHGPGGLFAKLAAALTAAFIYYGFVRGTAAGVLGPRAALLTAAVAATAAAVWPLGQPAGRIGVLGPTTVAVGWVFPAALVLASLAQRVGNVVAPLTAVFLMEWFAAVGTSLYAAFGRWPFYFAVVLLIAASAEIIIVERRRFLRAMKWFFRTVFIAGDAGDIVDAALFAAALSGIWFLYFSADVLSQKAFIRIPALTLWVIIALALREIGRRAGAARTPHGNARAVPR